MIFEPKQRDLVARIGKLKLNHGTIETPTLFPVINPNNQIIPAKNMKKYGSQALITNSYLLWKNNMDTVVSSGVHSFLDFKGSIMTDSGAFQLMEYGDVEVTNAQIIDFQKRIDVDIGVILDTPTSSRNENAVQRCIDKTCESAKESIGLIDKGRAWVGPLQGIAFPDLFKKCCNSMKKFDFDIYSVGSVVPLMVNYEYDKVLAGLAAAKMLLPMSKPMHVFGAGHPMFFSFLVALGADMFDSAAYALYAADNRYMTQTATYKLEDLSYLPCSCPVCSSKQPNELTQVDLAEHNLYVSFEEINLIKQSIKENTLWELLEQRSRAHPALLKAFRVLAKQKDLLLQNDPLTKKHLFNLSEFSKCSPSVIRAKQMAKAVKSKSVKIPLLGSVPLTLMNAYPFGNIVSEDKIEFEPEKDIEKVARDCSKYWFSRDIFPKSIKGRQSPKTKRLRSIESDTKLLVSVRASDFMFILHEAARQLHQLVKKPGYRVVVSNEVKEFVLEGKSVFAKFVKNCDQKIVPGQQVLVVDESDNLLAAGESLMSATEMRDFKTGPAVTIRWVNSKINKNPLKQT